VLGGQVLTEIDADGAKLRTFVYAGGSVLAWQVQQGAVQRVVWEHRDPSDASFRTTDSSGYPWGHADEEEAAELDPTGGNAGLIAPIVEPGPPPDEVNDSLIPYPRFHDARRASITYAVDYVQVTVDYFFQQLDMASHGSSLQLAEAAGRGTSYQQRWVRHGGYIDVYKYSSGSRTQAGYDVLTTGSHLVERQYLGSWETTAMPLTPSLMSLLSLVPAPAPQNPAQTQNPLKGVTGGASGSIDPCAGVKVSDLDYSGEHFTERHILDTDPAYKDRSKYAFSPLFGLRLAAEADPQKRLQMARQMVIDYDNWTFQGGGRSQSSPGSNIVFVYGFPKASGPGMDVEWFTGTMGKGQPHAGELTNVNTLVLGPDCRRVITSYPGLPSGSYTFGGTPPYYGKP
jgi:hypothetical protein